MIRIVLISLLSLIVFGARSQSNIRFAQLNFSQGINNPAALALDGRIMVDMMARNQWFGFEGAPTTFALNGQYEVMSDMAVGLNVYHDRIGVHQTTAIQGQYAYRFIYPGSRALAFGIGLGVDNHISEYANTITTVAQDPAFANSYSRLVFNSSVGMYYYSPQFYIGLSMPQMFVPRYTDQGQTRLTQNFHYYLSTGLYLGGDRYTFNPNIQIKATRNAPIAGDLILRNTFSGRWSLVVGYRTENSLIAGFDVLISPMVRAGYSFNYDIGTLSRAKGMSNELYLGLAFPYNNSREDFGKRRYISRKGGFKNDYRRRNKRINKRRLIKR